MAEQAQKVGSRIAELREERGWSRPELARHLPGVSTGNDVYRWEQGRHLPRSDTLDAIAEAFKVSVADLYAGPVGERPEKPNTPDLFAEEQPADIIARLERIEAGVQELLEHAGRQEIERAADELGQAQDPAHTESDERARGAGS